VAGVVHLALHCRPVHGRAAFGCRPCVSTAASAAGFGAAWSFYKNWMMPDNRSVSCCSEGDCDPTEAKLQDGIWFARRREGKWLRVPPDAIAARALNAVGSR